jgi:predicted DsbA family dithiol-disulfide isomerase
MFTEAGLAYADDIPKVPRSIRALVLGELARDRGLHETLHPRLFDAYWARGRDLGDEDVLVEEGAAVGLGEDEIRPALEDAAYRRRVEEQTTLAVQLGAGGVPAWVIDERLLVPGAQPHEVFDQALERLGHEPV